MYLPCFMLSIYQLGALSEEGEEGRQHVDDLVIGEEARLLSERENGTCHERGHREGLLERR